MNSDETALVPVEVRVIDFYGDRIPGALVQVGEEGRIYVPLRPISDYLGLAWSGQFERIKRDEVLSEEVVFVRVSRTNTLGGMQTALCLPLDYVPGWLFSISIKRVRPALQPVLYRYRRECFRVLSDAFLGHPWRLALDHTEEAPATTCPGTVYVVRGEQHYKIGVSRNVEQRLRKLNSALPFPITTVCTFETDDMLQLERELHRIYREAGKHTNGEWFQLSTNDLIALTSLPSSLPATSIPERLRTVERAAYQQQGSIV